LDFRLHPLVKRTREENGKIMESSREERRKESRVKEWVERK
jgi:hypothetical protein